MVPSWVWWIFQQASASILTATRWVWGTEIFLQNLQPKSQSTDRPGEFVCMIGVNIPEPWTGIRRDSSGLKATELCYSGTSKSRQARGWDQGTPGSELSFPDYTDRSSSALKVSKNLWQEFLLEIKIFVSPSGSCRNTKRYKRYFHFMQIFYIFFFTPQFFLIYHCKLQLMRNLCHHFTEFQLLEFLH